MRKLYLLRVGLGSWRLQVGLLDSVKHLDIEQTALDFCRDTWNA